MKKISVLIIITIISTLLSFAGNEPTNKSEKVNSLIESSKPNLVITVEGERVIKELGPNTWEITCTSPPHIFCVDIWLWADGHYEIDFGQDIKCSDDEPEVTEDEETGVTTVKFTSVDCD